MRLLLLSLLLSGALTLNAQVEFCPEGSKWVFEYRLFVTSSEWLFGVEEVEYVGDTIIEGAVTKKLKSTQIAVNIQASLEDTITLDGGYHYIRQEGEEVLQYYQGAFHPIYRFNMQVGDTMNLLYNGFNYMELNPTLFKGIHSISTVNIMGEERKMLHGGWGCEAIDYHSSNDFRIIEGIGAIDEYLFMNESSCMASVRPFFRCYFIHDELIYHTGPLDCDVLVNTHTPPKQHIDWRVFPNPTKDFWILDWELPHESQLKVIDMQGQVVHQQQIQMGQQQIPAAHLASGVYIFEVVNREGFGSRKVVRQ